MFLGDSVYSRFKKKYKEFEKFCITSLPTSAGICRKHSSLNRSKIILAINEQIIFACFAGSKLESKSNMRKVLSWQPSPNHQRTVLEFCFLKFWKENISIFGVVTLKIILLPCCFRHSNIILKLNE